MLNMSRLIVQVYSTNAVYRQPMTPETKQSSSVWDIRLDKAAPEPVYMQIAAAIRDLLRSGRIAPGAALPPEQLLARRFGVSRMTMRQANDVLEREG